MILLRRKKEFNGRFEHISEKDQWKFICDDGDHFFVDNCSAIPKEQHSEYKVLATFNPHNQKQIKIVKVHVIEEDDDLPDFGMAF